MLDLTYHWEGDYLIPDLEPPEAPRIGKYGTMRHNYLRDYHTGVFDGMLFKGTLNQHLEQIDREANEMMELLTTQMARAEGVTEALKTQDLLHEDNRLKFTLTVLCAAGWFVPGLWAGIGKAAEEVELACDELATGGLSPEDRQNYASLLLDAVSPAEGFTTCLSAAASGLKYRLGRVLHPQRMASSRLAAVLLTLILVFMFGSVGFSIRVGTIGSRVLSGDGGDWHVTEVTSASDQPCRDLQAVEDYLSNLEIEKPLWEEPLVVNGGDVILTLERPGGETKRISFSLDGTALYLADASDSAFRAQYLLVTPVDMNRLRTLAGGAA